MFENIAVGIITLLIYGIILMGCIIPFVFIVKTKHNITKFRRVGGCTYFGCSAYIVPVGKLVLQL